MVLGDEEAERGEVRLKPLQGDGEPRSFTLTDLEGLISELRRS